MSQIVRAKGLELTVTGLFSLRGHHLFGSILSTVMALVPTVKHLPLYVNG